MLEALGKLVVSNNQNNFFIFSKSVSGDSNQLTGAIDEIEDLSLLVFSEESLKQLQKRIEELKTERAQQKNKFK